MFTVSQCTCLILLPVRGTSGHSLDFLMLTTRFKSQTGENSVVTTV